MAATIGSSPPVAPVKSPDQDNAAWIFCRSAGGMPASASLKGGVLAASGFGAAGVTATVLVDFASGAFGSGALASAGRGCGSFGAAAVASLALVFLPSACSAFSAAAGT